MFRARVSLCLRCGERPTVKLLSLAARGVSVSGRTADAAAIVSRMSVSATTTLLLLAGVIAMLLAVGRFLAVIIIDPPTSHGLSGATALSSSG